MAAPRKSITQQIRENILVLVLSLRDINERLPSETTLTKLYKISQVTLREALSSLERCGIIIRKHEGWVRAIAFSQTVNSETEQERHFPVIASSRSNLHQRVSSATKFSGRKQQDVLDLAFTSTYKHKVQHFTRVETYIEHYNPSERQFSGNFDWLSRTE